MVVFWKKTELPEIVITAHITALIVFCETIKTSKYLACSFQIVENDRKKSERLEQASKYPEISFFYRIHHFRDDALIS